MSPFCKRKQKKRYACTCICIFRSFRMNYCNFAKVLIARETKSISTLQWWRKMTGDSRKSDQQPMGPERTENINDLSTSMTDTVDSADEMDSVETSGEFIPTETNCTAYRRQRKKPKHVYSTNFSLSCRHRNYTMFISGYADMSITSLKFKAAVQKLQQYLTKKRYWRKSGKVGGNIEFIEHFSVKSWCSLDESERSRHSLQNCVPCKTIHSKFSSLHKSFQYKCKMCKIVQ